MEVSGPRPGQTLNVDILQNFHLLGRIQDHFEALQRYFMVINLFSPNSRMFFS